MDRATESGLDHDFAEVLRRRLANDVRPHVLRLEHADEYPTEMVEQMRAFGLFGATILALE